MKHLTQFRIGIAMCIFQCSIFVIGAFFGKFNSTIFICMIFWTAWTIYFWNQRGSRGYLKIIPLKKDAIEIGDLVEEKGFPLSGVTSGISTCIVPGGADYSNKYAQPIQLIVIVNEKLKLGDTYLDFQSIELKPYTASALLELTALGKGFNDIFAKKVALFQKDLPQEFIQTVIEGKTKDGDNCIYRENKVFRERPFFENKLIIGCLLIFVCLLLGDVMRSVYVIFDKDNWAGKFLTSIIGVLIIAPILYQAIKFIFKHYKLKKQTNQFYED